MAANNNIDEDDMLQEVGANNQSAFDSIDVFKPKLYKKDLSFGKRRSFLCFINPAFDNGLESIDETGLEDEATPDNIYVDIVSENGDQSDLTKELPSNQHRNKQKRSSLRKRKVEKGRQNINGGDDNVDSGILQNMLPKTLGKWKQFKFSISMKWDSFKAGVGDAFKNIDFWKSNLKPVEGKFGSGVLSYFKFLRWLFLLNVLISFLVLAFVVAPQLMYSPSYKSNTASFTGMEFLTGKGWFLNTEMYYSTYGGYKNDTVVLSYQTPYNLTLSYLLVAGGYILICIIVLVRSMAISYKKNYISGQDFRNSFFTKIFCSWDYTVIQENSVNLQCKNIHNDLMESLTENREKEKKGFNQILALACQRLLAHLIVIGLMGGGCYAIVWCKRHGVDFLKEKLPLTTWTDVFFNLFPIIVLTAVNIILPFMFRIIASQERYESPRTTVEVSLFRTVVLKLSTLCVYIWLVYTDIEKDADTNAAKAISNSTVQQTPSVCWEKKIEVQFYQLAVVDFIFVILETLFGEMIRRGFASCMNACGFHFDYPGFDISRNVLGLIYSQGLCWLGAFFCPMLPLITVIKFFILFYYKKISVLTFCRASLRPFRASKMRLRFFVLLSFMLALAVAVIGLITINETNLKPSADCGPFRGKKSIFSTVQVVLDRDFGKDLRGIAKTVASTIVLAMVFFVFGMIIYFQRLRKSSAEKKIKLLKEQIALAGHDKMFLLDQIRTILEARGKYSRKR